MHNHCPTWQIPPFSSITYISFVPQLYSFPQTVLKCMFSTLKEQSMLLSVSFSVTYCFHTLLCLLQIVLASEFCYKSRPLSWTPWDHLESPGHWWFQIYDYLWRHCQWNSLSFFSSISNTYQLTLYMCIFWLCYTRSCIF